MSIIHDALKKVQEKNAKLTPPPAQAPSIREQAVSPDADTSLPQTHSRPLTILLLGTLSIVVIIIFAILWSVAKGTTEHAAPASSVQPAETIPAPQQPVAAEVIPQTPAPAPTSLNLATSVLAPAAPQIDPNDPLSSLRIEGIMDMGDKKVALISGNIYEEGQTIYGKIIAEITLDSVTIVDNGSKRTFPVNPPKP